MKLSSILGINARTQLFAYRFNSVKGKKAADSKIQTDRILRKNDIAHPVLYAKFKKLSDLERFDFGKLPSSFALKPSRGMGGEGIIVVKKRADDGNGWITTDRKKVTVSDIKFHILDILEGAFSMGNIPDVALIQEYVGRHKVLQKYSFRGTPDIRVIVFNKIPIMAMLRLPTRESGGRANLHQGAIAVGVDIATGITTRAYWKGRFIKYKPSYKIKRFGPFGIFKKVLKEDTKRKLNGIRIPNWDGVLETAVKAQEASGMGYLGVDIVLHPEKGPMVLELNAQPGLQIQLANRAGLKRRLEKVDDMEVKTYEQGIKIAKSLFYANFAHSVKNKDEIKRIGAVEEINIKDSNGKMVSVLAKMDTGAWSSSIDKSFAKELGIFDENNILIYKNAISALGREKRPVIPVTCEISGRKIKGYFTVSNRKHLTYKVNIGRTELKGFLVDAQIKI